MRRTLMVSLLFAAGCLGGKSDSNNTQGLNQQQNTTPDENTMDRPNEPGTPTDPMDPGDPNDPCFALRDQLGICWENVAVDCFDEQQAAADCYAGVDLLCQDAYAALDACFQSGNMDCSAEWAAVDACRLSAEQCIPLDEAAYACSSVCLMLEEAYTQQCLQPPPPPDLPPYCPPLFDALALCQSEAAQFCGIWEDHGGMDDGSGMYPQPPPEDCFARCVSIEVAINELCPIEQPPCDQPGYPDDGGGMGHDPRDPGNPNGGGM